MIGVVVSLKSMIANSYEPNIYNLLLIPLI